MLPTKIVVIGAGSASFGLNTISALMGSERLRGSHLALVDRSEDLFVVDFISRYDLNESMELYLKFDNLLDEQAIVSRQPDGARPNKPRTASLGFNWTF